MLRYPTRVCLAFSDPGHDLVKAAIEEDIAVVTVPGASAGISALIASGLAPQPHIFYGFLPRKSGQQKQFFDSKKTILKLKFSMNRPIVWQIRWKIC